MRMKRQGVNKRRSASQFRRSVGRTHPRNMTLTPPRGGYRA